MAAESVDSNKSKWAGSGALQQILAFASLIILIIFFSLASDNFLQWSNISGILLSTTVIGILAIGTTFVIITGGIDLSIGTGMTLCSVMTGVFLVYLDLPIVIGVLGGIATGALIGLFNGFSVAVLGIPSFIATLAMMMIAEGLALVISGASPIYFSDITGFNSIALGSIIPGVPIPNAVLVFFIMVLIGWLLLSKSIVGRYTYSMGSNEEATRLSGININRWKMKIFTIAGAFTGVAGVIMASRLNSAQPALGMGYELEAIAAVVIGGTSLSGGRGSIVGTMIGALIMSVLTNGLRIMSIPQEWQTVVIGFVILLAVYIDMLRRRKSA
ncbi:ABC transporter permease [Virgibacillus halodenitrificans]|jgi:ribose transport system permease protein|uniref:ABC transporter permease n=1 Tax=Virgibacillus halodenitrificans TaxID=1482 RepID=A0ABR7VLI7_VIRHA|nr:ABC transporter permease [Virgibacillus halodenitrificans]MBD1221362.1 ABC transporter permease [Virgibacillus halodenitrificans]